MASILTAIGLHSVPPNGVQPPSYAATAIIANFLMAHAVLSARGPKVLLGLDHNVSPREDLAKYGEKMVQAGKMTRQQLRRLIRWESAHANAVENFPMFFGSVLMALHAGVPNGTVNGLCLIFTLVRIGHAVAYIMTENVQLSYIRSLFWWAGNFTCFTLLGLAGKQLNA